MKLRQFQVGWIIGSKTLTYLSLLYLFIDITICYVIWMYKIKGRELLFISTYWAVEGLICRYINSPHASFIFITSTQGIDGYTNTVLI